MLFEEQQHQTDCVNNILVALNNIKLTEVDVTGLKDNLRKIARERNTLQNFPYEDDKRIDVMMETGTGKTFVYLQTIFELYKHHNQRKFIIVVPRTAIKLGVIQQIKQTREYFFRIYEKHLNYINYPDDGLEIIQHSFINSKDLSVLLITNSSFNKKDNAINRTAESPLAGVLTSTWQAICAQKPVVLIDEPHLLKGNKTTKYLSMLDGLSIRFGATFPDKANKEDKGEETEQNLSQHHLSNVAYCLDSISAFNQYLVKRIRVSTIFVNSEESALHIHNITAKRSFDAHYNINEQLNKITAYLDEDLGAKTGLEKYNGVKIIKITSKKVLLSSHQEMESNKGNYQLSDPEIVTMIRQTIRLHFEKEEGLFKRGIKALSLFFIPGVNDFRGENPQVKTIFEQEYKKIRQEFYDKSEDADYKRYLDADYNDKNELQVHEGYFAGDKGKTKEEKEANAIDTILNDKEGLLSFKEPLRFVFSVWALQEGWDNPNIFTICKLSNTSKEVSRRQQVGRGLRIAVNQKGRRLSYKHMKEKENSFYGINTLDMIVSSQEQGFVHEIQNEIAENSFSIVGDILSLNMLKDKGLCDWEVTLIHCALLKKAIIDKNGTILMPVADFLRDNRKLFSEIKDERFTYILQLFQSNARAVEDANARPRKVKVRLDRWKEFKGLWESINKESKIIYTGIETDKHIARIAREFNDLDIKTTKGRKETEIIKISKTESNSLNVLRESDAVYDTGPESDYYKRHPIESFIQELAQNEKLPLMFFCALFSKLKIEHFNKNPLKARQELIRIIQSEIHKTILQHISYKFSKKTILANSLQEEDGKCIKELPYKKLGQFYSKRDEPGDNFLYDTVVYDSYIEKGAILNDPPGVNDKKITVFAKLPQIKIPTPYKTYNPDFAYMIQTKDKKELFLVVETKGYESEERIPEEEKTKIEYAKKFFRDLEKQMQENDPDFVIRFKSRINKEELSQIITDAFQDPPSPSKP